VNFVKCSSSIVCISKTHIISSLFLSILLSIYLLGCSDQVRPPSPAQLAEFGNAGPVGPSVDMDRLVRAKIGGGAYRVVPGEVLELTMPTILQVVTAEEPEIFGEMAPYMCRISEAGTITLPVVGEIEVAGRTLAEIESAIIEVYHPEYTVTRPSVFARILEYKMAKVSIAGAVARPGIYSLRSDQMSLVALLMEAGGIIDEGAALIRIVHSDDVAPNDEQAAIETIRETVEQGIEEIETVEVVEEKVEEILEEPVEQLAEPSETGLAEPPIHSTGSNTIEVQLSFRRSAPAGTIGQLTVKYDEAILLAEQTDITSEIERQVFLEMLILREPRVSTADVNQKLCSLAELLKPGCGKRESENQTANENANPDARLGGDNTERQALLEKLSAMLPDVSTAIAQQEPLMPPVLPEPSHSMRITEREAANQSIASNTERSESDSGQNSTTAEALDEEPLEIPGPEESSESGEQIEPAYPRERESLVLPVKGLNIPFADVALHDGDSVIVERLQLPLFTVIGLVNNPGNFPYPPQVQYNLMQALAFAGGLDRPADPRYATVYRLKPDGAIVNTTLKIVEDSRLTDALKTLIKPGDIVAVEQTPRTRTNLFLDRTFRFNIGTYLRLDDLGDD
jgi:protein involved in polysaccharide export with SLBB domain